LELHEGVQLISRFPKVFVTVSEVWVKNKMPVMHVLNISDWLSELLVIVRGIWFSRDVSNK
jgi:hypothetical protein